MVAYVPLSVKSRKSVITYDASNLSHLIDLLIDICLYNLKLKQHTQATTCINMCIG